MKRYLFLGDNLGQILSFQKGRASDPKLNQCCRRWAALQLALFCRCYARWLLSEMNPADEPSRRFEPPPRHGSAKMAHAPGHGACAASDGGEVSVMLTLSSGPGFSPPPSWPRSSAS